MGIRRKARELALQALYLSEFSGRPAGESLEMLGERFEINHKAMPYARRLVEGVAGHWQEIDERIREHAANWRLERMSYVDRNIIRLAVFELIFEQSEVPASAAINEAIEVAHRFSTDEAAPFINGILDAIRQSLS